MFAVVCSTVFSISLACSTSLWKPRYYSNLSFFLQLHWGEGGKRDCSKHNAFRMYYLVWLQTGGEELAPPFLCLDPRWCRTSCGTCGDGAEEAAGQCCSRRVWVLGWHPLAPVLLSYCDLHSWGLLPAIKSEDSEGQLCSMSDKKKVTSHWLLWCFYLIIFGAAELIRFFLIHLYIIEVIWITVQPPYYLCIWKAICYSWWQCRFLLW